MSQSDQAAGLRRWAESMTPPQPSPSQEATPSRVLLTLGLPEGADSDVEPVMDALCRWHERGQSWVGDPAAWRVVALDAQSPHVAALASQQKRWALWVDDDADGFRRAYRTLKQLARHPGTPRRLLMVHPPLLSGAGLLGNLRDAAAHFFGIQLVMIGFTKPRGKRT
ncbi:hypothetical protein MHM84_02225 [Halomonas sp. McH1-25]|uniref:hypothetical protein n=1 Tax=unclassified Halomonas TaxID=2609666 RepID=UPI001EF5C3D1|nr:MULTISPECIES: hypothetical protein [unclassified Halomonas]MCG7598599.1 hypothetical protein [Halomonas sp. McH1-25]MCP1342295.1 hypothetical protein [Halomonas sp. FL8]MCP1360630.1 hypothetical protein [Halomonas sp. BBD45]MCP1365743.1 hypothetical protein [Halomonas sp. BBD48]